MSKLSKRRRRKVLAKNPSATANPPIGTDLMEFILPGFGAFAITRLGVRAATMLVAKKKPAWARHAGALASIASFAAAWFGAHRIKALAKYHDALVIGTGIAAAQTVIQTYIPALGWVTADVKPSDLAPPATSVPLATPAGDVLLEDPTWYTVTDAYDNGRSRPADNSNMTPARNVPASTPRTDASSSAAVDDLLADLEPGMESGWAFASEN